MSRIVLVLLLLAFTGDPSQASPHSVEATVSEELGGEWHRAIPPAFTSLMRVFDPGRSEWIIAGFKGSEAGAEIWTSPASRAEWKRGEAAGHPDPFLSDEFTAWDRAGDRLLVLFVPWDSNEPLLVWECDRSRGDVWRPLEPAGDPPSYRLQPVVAFDEVGRRMFVTGGRGLDNQIVDDGVWMLELEPTPRWSRVVTEGPAPAARMDAAAGFDGARQWLVLYGGAVLQGDGSVRERTEEVWFLDLSSEPRHWRLIASTSPGPGPGDYSNVVADPVRDRILTFGGPAQGNGIWEMSLAAPGTWRAVGIGTPSMVHAGIGKVDGEDVITVLTQERELWRLDLGSMQWTQIDAGSRGTPNFTASLAVDPRDGSVLIVHFIGHPTGLVHHVTKYVPGDELGRFETLEPSGTPPPRILGSAVWDPVRRRFLFPGTTMSATAIDEVAVLETEPSLAWGILVTEGGGPIGQELAVLYDRNRDRLVVIEEDPATLGVFQDALSRSRVWTLPLGGPATWTLESIEGPIPTGRPRVAVGLDRRRDRVLLPGGSRFIRGTSNSVRFYDDIWALDLEPPMTWATALPPLNPLPTASMGADVDSWTDRLRLIGGSQFVPWYAFDPFARDSLHAFDLASGRVEPALASRGFRGIPNGRTLFDPAAGRAFHFSNRNVWEWTGEARHDVRITSAGSAEAGRQVRAPRIVVVHGEDRFDPESIDGRTVRINGVPALSAPGGSPRREDMDGDGFPDRRFLVPGPAFSGDVIELRAQDRLGVRVIGISRPAAMRQPHPATHRPETHPIGAVPLSVRSLAGSSPSLVVEGGASARVEIDVYDVRGRHLGRTRRERAGAETLTIELPPVPATPGIRFIRVRVGDEIRTLRHVALD